MNAYELVNLGAIAAAERAGLDVPHCLFTRFLVLSGRLSEKRGVVLSEARAALPAPYRPWLGGESDDDR